MKQELGLGGGALTLRGLSGGSISATTGTGDVAAYGKGTVADDCIVNDGSEIEQG